MSKDVLMFKSVGYSLLFLFAIICLIPFLIVIGSSFTSEASIIKYGYSIWPKEFSMNSYETIFKSPVTIFRAYGVTIIVTAVGTSLSVFLNAIRRMRRTTTRLSRKRRHWCALWDLRRHRRRRQGKYCI